MKNKKQRKQRTRSHVIADRSANHFEYHALQCGFSVEVVSNDYGYDGVLYTYRSNGEIENGSIFIQLKATDSIERFNTSYGWSFPVEKVDLDTWLNEPFPAYLVLYDAITEQSYWVYIQAFFERKNLKINDIKGATFNVHIDKECVVDKESIMLWRAAKESILSQLEGVISHA